MNLKTIQDAAELPPQEALQRLEEIAREVDAAMCMVENKIRVLKYHLPPLPDPNPSWFNGALKDALEENPYRAPGVDIIDTSRRFAALVDGLLGGMPHLSVMVHGSMQIAWNSPLVVRVLVHSAKMAWPGVKLRVFHRRHEDANLVDKLFLTAHSALAHVQELVA